MENFNLDQLDDKFDYIYEIDENDWTNAVLGDEEDVIRQLVG